MLDDPKIIERIKEIRIYVNNKIESADNIEDYSFKCLAIFSLLESFAQEWSNYPSKGTAKAFREFVMHFQESYPYLDAIDPVTLYYDFREDLKGQFSLDYMHDGNYYYAKVLANNIEAKQIKQYLINTKKGKKTDICYRINQHKYINLLYIMRSKISHEHCYYSWSKIADVWEIYEPCFISCGSDWILGFPYQFIKQLTEECITRYLNECEKKKEDPFKNNLDSRKFRLTWVDNVKDSPSRAGF